jgi:hypothetical protein
MQFRESATNALGSQPVLGSDWEKWRLFATRYPIDRKFKVAPPGTLGFSRDRFRICPSRLADKLPLEEELVPVRPASLINAHQSSSPRTLGVTGLSEVATHLRIQYHDPPSEVRGFEPAALDLETDEWNGDAEAAG